MPPMKTSHNRAVKKILLFMTIYILANHEIGRIDPNPSTTVNIVKCSDPLSGFSLSFRPQRNLTPLRTV